MIIQILLIGCYSSSKTLPTETNIENVIDEDGDGYISSEDCNDNDPYIYNGATEVCDGIDNDCDDEIDEGVLLEFYEDLDGDGFGNSQVIIRVCEASEGLVGNGNDCFDDDPDSYPGAIELCDGIDNDCDDEIDEDVGNTYYEDLDGDGFGSDVMQFFCEEMTGWVTETGDCNDEDIEIFPNAMEYCDEIDNNCDGEIDEATAVDTEIWYLDNDGDSFGDPNQSISSCNQESGYVAVDGDCDDTDVIVNPDAIEVCDGIDNDCSGDFDEGMIGLGPTCAALSCQDVLDQSPFRTDGIYWIDPKGTGSYEAYCDMTQNGGGWTLLLKTTGIVNTHFYYSDPLWESNTLLNETSVDTSDTNAKLQPFVDLDVSEFYGCFPSQGNHCIYANTGIEQTAKELFSAGSLQIGSGFNNQMYSGWSHQSNCTFFGFNSEFSGLRVRFGFSANQENNCNSNDTAIGFGLGFPNTSIHQSNYGSGEICAWYGCSLSNYQYAGFPALLFGR